VHRSSNDSLFVIAHHGNTSLRRCCTSFVNSGGPSFLAPGFPLAREMRRRGVSMPRVKFQRAVLTSRQEPAAAQETIPAPANVSRARPGPLTKRVRDSAAHTRGARRGSASPPPITARVPTGSAAKPPTIANSEADQRGRDRAVQDGEARAPDARGGRAVLARENGPLAESPKQGQRQQQRHEDRERDQCIGRQT